MSGSQQRGSPYRGGDGVAPSGPAPSDGLVAELIEQFADPFAFHRELVQNAIDAGASRVAITLAWEPPAPHQAEGTARVAVSDDGCGMGRDVLEDQLTVLFRSSKEGDESSIGKFGVGFVSVLALQPSLVTVATSEGRGRAFTLELLADQSYELFEAPGGQSRGTTVTLTVAASRARFTEIIEGSRRALLTWCRFASLPIRAVAHAAGGEELLLDLRVDRPLGFEEAVAQVRVDEGGTTVIAGLAHPSRTYVGFFKRGLLLHQRESDEPGVLLAVQDAGLEHTLSRDSVRTDDAYERAMKRARRAITRELVRHVDALFRELASGGRTEPALDVLLGAAHAAGLAFDRGAVRLPLIAPVRGRDHMGLSSLDGRCYLADARSPLVEAAAAGGIRVLDTRIAADPDAYAELLSGLASAPLRPASDALTLATPIEADGSDTLLLEVVGDVLAPLVPRPTLRWVRLSGRSADALSVTGRSDGALPAALEGPEAQRDPFVRWRRPPLWINARHPMAEASRRAAVERPALAGALLARAILVDRGRLDDDALDERWLAAARAAVSDA